MDTICFLGQMIIGACFSFLFGITSEIFLNDWWGRLPGTIIGSLFGVFFASSPDKKPQLLRLVVCVPPTTALTIYAQILLPSEDFLVSLMSSTCTSGILLMFTSYQNHLKITQSLELEYQQEMFEKEMTSSSKNKSKSKQKRPHFRESIGFGLDTYFSEEEEDEEESWFERDRRRALTSSQMLNYDSDDQAPPTGLFSTLFGIRW